MCSVAQTSGQAIIYICYKHLLTYLTLLILAHIKGALCDFLRACKQRDRASDAGNSSFSGAFRCSLKLDVDICMC